MMNEEQCGWISNDNRTYQSVLDQKSDISNIKLQRYFQKEIWCVFTGVSTTTTNGLLTNVFDATSEPCKKTTTDDFLKL